ncbi:MAG: hypothetical protein R2864_03950 [Syntrophotaleaceae bacterium]
MEAAVEMEQLIQDSTDRYQAMLAYLAEMAEMLKTADPAAIKLVLEQWNHLQQDAQQLDSLPDIRRDAIRRK